MPRITQHGKARLIERDETISCAAEAKRSMKQAWISGKTIGRFQKYPPVYEYLLKKKNKHPSCSFRVYHNIIYIYRGTHHSLVTAYPIPEYLILLMQEADENGCNGTFD